MRKPHRSSLLLAPFCLAFAVACAPAEAPPAAAPSGAAPAAAGGDQVAEGKALFTAHCASCHGSGGEGVAGKVPALVGATALPLDPPAGAKARKVQFHTAADVFMWVKANMPPGAGGSLTDTQYAAIMAFDLKANGVDLTGKTVDASTAPGIVLHP